MSEETADPDGQSPAPERAPAAAPAVYPSAAVDRARIALRDMDETVALVPEATSGAIIGRRYKLLELIGEGGMGVVWMAEQRSPIRRLVAVKLIKAGMDSAAVLARFEAERQALAMMDHPNIARIFDGGTTERGHPYFVMELVKGLPLTRYCDERKMPLNERLDLFVQVCSAVQHAHQKGIIHRDLKPGNLLVTEHDGKPVPKVIDFGLVKALAGSSVLTDHTLHTSYGAVAGTPHYMAPEQVAINALDVDTRADIYALGVILYELLAGTTPHQPKDLQQVAWDEMRRVIREVDPPRPSLRVTQSKTLPQLAVTRHTEPARLSKLIAGDLDWIVMKALEKDRHRRYGTASDLAADLQRHLAGEAVLAAPPTAAYRLRKFARKYRVGLTTAAVVLIVLIAGVLASTWQAIRASHAELVAQHETTEAQNQKQEAQRQRETAVAASRKAEAQAATVHRQLADSYIQNGIAAWVDHDPGLAAVWFSRALKLDQGDPHRELMDRIRLGDSFRQCVWPKAAPTEAERWIADSEPCYVSEIVRQPDGSVVAAATGAHIEVTFPVRSAYQVGDILLLCGEKTAQLFDHKTGKQLSPPLPVPNAGGFERSIDRRFAAVQGPTLRIWEVQTGRPVTLGADVEFHRVKFSPDSKHVVVSDRTSAQVWNLETSTREGVAVALSEGESLGQINNRGQLLLLTNDHTGSRVVNTANGEAIGPHLNMGQMRFGSFQLSPDGKRLIAQADAKHFSLFDTCTGTELCSPVVVVGDPVFFSKDGKWVRSGLLQWDASITAPAGPVLYKAHAPGARNFQLTADRRTMATYSWQLRSWNADTLQPLSPPATFDAESLAFRPNSDEIVTIYPDQGRWRLGVRSIASGELVRPAADLWEDNGFFGSSFATSPDGNYVLVNLPGFRKFEVFSVQPKVELVSAISAIVTESDGNICPTAFSPDSQALVGWQSGGKLVAWNVKTGQLIPNPPLAWRDLAVSGVLSPDGKSYLSVWESEARMLALQDDTALTPTFPGALGNASDSLGLNGQVVLTKLDNSIRLWDARTAQAVTSALPCDAVTEAAGIHRDGRSVYSLSRAGRDNYSSSVLRRWSIAASEFSADDSEILAQLISGRKIDELGGIIAIWPSDYSSDVELLTRLQRESPALFRSTVLLHPTDVLPSYRREVDARVTAARTPDQKKSLARELAHLGKLEIDNKLYYEAALLEEKSLSLDDSSLVAKDHLAHAYAGMGRFAEALAIYQKYAGQSYGTPEPWSEQGQVAGDLADLAEIWPDGNDDPAFQRIRDLNDVNVLPPTTAPAVYAKRLAEDAVAQFKLNHILESHDLLRKALHAGSNAPGDNDLTSQLLTARSLIDPPSTQPIDELADDLNTAAWGVVQTPGRSPDRYALALDIIHRSIAISATPYNLGTLGAAQFRTGDFKGALDSLARSEATDFVAQENHVTNLLFSAMARQKLGQHSLARALLQKVIELNKDAVFLNAEEQMIFDEAAGMVDPASTQPTTKPTTAQ